MIIKDSTNSNKYKFVSSHLWSIKVNAPTRNILIWTAQIKFGQEQPRTKDKIGESLSHERI